ncbi:ribosome silencing factor [Thiohalospira sp.]|uniref:ribosome silencing factor n=1 Tax=Thiohalospira sp. TaxID=3080549 RepID=UPI00397F2D78
MESDALQDLVTDALEELKGQDIRVLDVRDQSTVTDTMVIAGGGSARQVQAMAERVVERAKAAGVQPLGVEGEETGDWIVVDLGDVVCHVMRPEVRDFYNLEKLWAMDAAPGEGTGGE